MFTLDKKEYDETKLDNKGKIAFNSRYLSDVLAVLNKDKVALEMTTSSSPGVIRPLDNEDYVHVVMPMFVQW